MSEFKVNLKVLSEHCELLNNEYHMLRLSESKLGLLCSELSYEPEFKTVGNVLKMKEDEIDQCCASIRKMKAAIDEIISKYDMCEDNLIERCSYIKTEG